MGLTRATTAPETYPCPGCRGGRLAAVRREGGVELVCDSGCLSMRLRLDGKGGERWCGILGDGAGLRVLIVGLERACWDVALRERRAGQCVIVAPC